MNIELLGQFSQRLLTPYGSQSHLRLEGRRMVPAWSFAHRLSCSAAILAAVRQKRHLSNLSKNPEPALTRTVYSDRGGYAVLEHWLRHELGHGWSGGAPHFHTEPRGPDASREMVRFFLARSRRG